MCRSVSAPTMVRPVAGTAERYGAHECSSPPPLASPAHADDVSDEETPARVPTIPTTGRRHSHTDVMVTPPRQPEAARSVTPPRPSHLRTPGASERRTVTAPKEVPKPKAIHRARHATTQPALSVDLLQCKMQFATRVHETAFELAETVPSLVLFHTQRRIVLRAGMWQCLDLRIMSNMNHSKFYVHCVCALADDADAMLSWMGAIDATMQALQSQ